MRTFGSQNKLARMKSHSQPDISADLLKKKKPDADRNTGRQAEFDLRESGLDF